MLFEIAAKEIEQLDSSPFVDFLNHLIDAECNKLGISPTKVKTSSELTSAEGGIDGRIEDDERQGDKRWIPRGLSVWQFKTGRNSTTPRQLEKEAIKPEVLKALADGGHYVVAIARICDIRMRKARENALRKAIRRRGFGSDRVTLLTADDLTKWASEHPSMLLLGCFHRSLGRCMRQEQWERIEIHQGPFIADSSREQIIERLRSFTALGTSPVHMRILGRRGAGKTRLVMEALRPKGVRERVVYAQEPEDVPPELWAQLKANTVTSAILVINQCDDEEETSKLKEQVEVCEGRVRLITIGVGEPFLSETSRYHLFLDLLDDNSMTKMLQERFMGLSYERIAWIVRIAGGYPKLAVTCGEVMAGRQDIDIAKLTQTVEIRENLKFLPDPKVKAVMQALSLLTRVGFEGEVIGEGQTLAGFVQVQWTEFYAIVEQMRHQGLVGKKGRYRYVTPDLLASWLAADLWDARTENVRGLLSILPTVESRRAFLERLRDLGTDEKARRVVRELLSEQDFPTIERLDSEDGSGIVHMLALADRHLALGTLERLLSNVSPDRLLAFRKGRRNVVNCLDYLKWFKDTFFGAARLLLLLAEEENEEWANNATGVWKSIFQLRLGGTEVPVSDRLSLVDEALSSSSSRKKLLALEAIATLLSAHEIRTSGLERRGAQPVPYEWHPKSIEEIWGIYRTALGHIDQAVQDTEPKVARVARSTLLRSSRTIVAVGLGDEIIGRLEAINPQDDEERREARDAVRIILQYERVKLNDSQRSRLNTIEDRLAGTSFHDRLRRWVGQWSFGDWTIEEREGGLPPRDRAAVLAEEAVSHPELLHDELEWLISDEAQNVAYFGRRLGELDRHCSWLAQLVDRTRQGGRQIFLASYLWGRSSAGETEKVCELMDKWAADDRQLAPVILVTTTNLKPSTENLNRILRLVDRGWLQRKELTFLVWSGWSEKLPIDAFEKFLGCLLLDQEAQATEAALHLLDRRLKLFPEERDRLATFAWQVLERESAVKGTMSQHLWGELSRHLIQSDPVKIAETVLKIYENPQILLHQDSTPMKALAEATKSRPEEVWNRVGKVLLGKDERSYRLQLGLEFWYVELLGVDQLLSWANKHLPEGPRILAALTSPTGKPLNDLPRRLLTQFEHDEYVGSRLHANFQTGTFTGSTTNWLQGKLEIARVWISDSDPKVCRWARKIVESLEERIGKWNRYEQEEQLA